MTETPPPDRRALLMFLVWLTVMAYVMAVVLADERVARNG